MKKIILAIAFFWALSMSVSAQSIWDANHLERVKQSIHEPQYQPAYEALIERANQVVGLEPVSVMQKEKTPASGNKHDYMSQARYYWPDTTKADGKPYINRDGHSNPELDKLDRNRLAEVAARVSTLSTAWYFSGQKQYAEKAAQLLRVWFFDAETKMNPNLNYAQVIPGHNNDQGRCYGVIDTYSFVEMLDAVQLLEKSEAFTSADSKQLKAWFSELLNWILESEQGQEEARQKNNHSVAHDAQVIAFALYAENMEVAKAFLTNFPERRMFAQIEPDGSQPQELHRTLAFGYSQFNLHHMVDVFLMGRKLGMRLDEATSADGRNFYKAVDFLTPYLGKPVSDWPYQQISDWDSKQQELCRDLFRIYSFNPKRTDYLELYKAHHTSSPSDRIRLLY